MKFELDEIGPICVERTSETCHFIINTSENHKNNTTTPNGDEEGFGGKEIGGIGRI